MPFGIDAGVLGAIGGIILVDLALSGDNALVIGAAAAGLPARQRAMAIGLGGLGAIMLRATFAIAATLLLRFPLLQALGGLVLLWIAMRLLMERNDKPGGTQSLTELELAGEETAHRKRLAARGFFGALLTIVVADVTMSLDNVLAVGALAAGQVPLLVAGLALSMALLLVGSALIAALIGRLSWLLDVAALVLGWTAGNMVLHDPRLAPFWKTLPWSAVIVHALTIVFVVAVDLLVRRRDSRRLAARSTSATAKANREENETNQSVTSPLS